MFNFGKPEGKVASTLDTSILAICGGAVVISMYPAFTAIGLSMAWAGACGLCYHVATRSKFDQLWKNLNLVKGTAVPIKLERKKRDKSTFYRFTLPTGLTIEDFERNKFAIEQFLNQEVDIYYVNGTVGIEIYDDRRRKVYPFQVEHCEGDVAFPIGYNRRGGLVTCDLATNEPHLLVAGETGSGKSTALRAIIVNLVLTKNVKLHLIDLKRGAEFQIFSRCKKVTTFSRTIEEATKVLSDISYEIDRRYSLFAENEVPDIRTYNKGHQRMGYEVLIIDEFAELHSDKAAIDRLESIAARARACGIHLILSSQRPDHVVLNGRIKANVANVLGLKTINETNSRIILDHEGLEQLDGSGHAIFKRGKETEVQCPFLTTGEAINLVRATYADKAIKKGPRPSNGEVPDFDCLELIIK